MGLKPTTRHKLAPVLLLTLILNSGLVRAQEGRHKSANRETESTLVRVSITTETRGTGESITINGRRIPDYQPKIIHVFPATGVVMDQKGHVLTFLGYRWVDIQRPNPRIDIITWRGERYSGKLVGIDENIGVAVVRSQGAKLQKTPLCEGCEVRDGLTVVAPVAADAGISDFQSVQILSTGRGNGPAATGIWTIKVNRPLPGVGGPLLDTLHRVLGFVSSQKLSPEDPKGASTAVYHPMSQLLASAEKILKAGTDIRTGWLGVFVNDEASASSWGVAIDGVEQDSPAQKAGLLAGDFVTRYGSKEIENARQFIRLVQDTPIGSIITLDVFRKGKPVTLQALIEPRKRPQASEKFVFSFPDVLRLSGNLDSLVGTGFNAGMDSWAGIEAVPLTPQLAEFLQMPGKSGLFVVSVTEQMPFSLAGVQAGDVILTVDGQRVENPRSFFSHVQSRSRDAQMMLVKLLRKGAERVATIRFTRSSSPAPQPPGP